MKYPIKKIPFDFGEICVCSCLVHLKNKYKETIRGHGLIE